MPLLPLHVSFPAGEYRDHRTSPTAGRLVLSTIRRVRALLLVGGWAHPAEQTGPPTAAALASLGFTVDTVTSLYDVTAALADAEYDLLVVHACMFQMLDARYTSAQRATFASTTPAGFRTAVESHLAAGRPLLGMHTAALCFDDWPEWAGLLGATWSWERSNHPPPGPFGVKFTDDAMVNGLHPIEVVDELYRYVTPARGAVVLATATDDAAVTHPVAWRGSSTVARVAYSSLGHDARSLENSGHRALLGRIVAWLLAS